MPRIIVTTQPARLPDDAEVLLDEDVHSVHLSSGHAAAQLIERLSWAIGDAEDAESSRRERHTSSRPARTRHPARLRERPAGAGMRVALGA